jgi:electron transfer flavoprotein beta subunit
VPDTKIIKINPKTNTLDHRSAPAILNPLLTCRTRSGKNKKKAGGKVNIILSSGSI